MDNSRPIYNTLPMFIEFKCVYISSSEDAKPVHKDQLATAVLLLSLLDESKASLHQLLE